MDHIDPRARWIFSFAFLIAATSTWNWMFLLTYFIIALIWYRLGNTTWKETRSGWRLVLFMLFMMIVINTIITGGGAGGVVPPGGQLVGQTASTSLEKPFILGLPSNGYGLPFARFYAS